MSTVVLDTNILLRLANPAAKEHDVCRGAIVELRRFGERAARWAQQSCQYFQASFLEKVRRFVPIPVAVVRVVG